jgi:hypothetical protein
MGSDYGLRKGVPVDFYEIVDNSDIVPGAKYAEKIFAHGEVTKEIDQTEAWIDVSSPSKANVMRGHFVRLALKQANVSVRFA